MSTCRSCGEPVRWVEIRKSGKKMPLDVDPVSNGNVVIEADGRAAVLPALANYQGEKYVTHFDTCPEAKRWRR
jgi:hypothetical protein